MSKKPLIIATVAAALFTSGLYAAINTNSAKNSCHVKGGCSQKHQCNSKCTCGNKK